MPYAYASHQLDQHKSTGKKAACRMLMKLTPGVNLINILRADFMCADLKSAKKTGKLSIFFALL